MYFGTKSTTRYYCHYSMNHCFPLSYKFDFRRLISCLAILLLSIQNTERNKSESSAEKKGSIAGKDTSSYLMMQDWMLSPVRNKTRMSTYTTFIQYYISNVRQWNNSRKKKLKEKCGLCRWNHFLWNKF